MEIVGISKENVEKISEIKKEEDWIKSFRLKAYESFKNQSNPKFGPTIDLNYDDIIYYKSNEADKKIESDWNNVLKPVVDELDGLGVLESEKHLGGMGVQYESEVIYHKMLDELEAKKISFLVPDANVTYAHGRMNKTELEDVMIKFENKEYDVLVCTTIIETGIDIPNVNTLIIIDADRFGLSQLYQIRGYFVKIN